MPNPLIGATPLNVGKRADEREHAIPPRPESYAGDNIPYRGIENHGVESPVNPDPFDGYDDTVSGIYEPEQRGPDPIPVRIVNTDGKEIRMWTPNQDQIPAAGVVRQIAGLNLTRTRIKIVNMGAAVIFIGPTPNVSPYTGYPLYPITAAGASEMDLSTHNAIYACTDFATAAVQNVGMLEEYTVREK